MKAHLRGENKVQLEPETKGKGGSHLGTGCQLLAASKGHWMQLSPAVLPSQWAQLEKNSQMASTQGKGRFMKEKERGEAKQESSHFQPP